jgi:rod shape-determining protein MreD
MNPYVATILLLFTALLQTQFLPAFLPGVNQYVPDLLLLIVVSWALVLDWRWTLPTAFGAGLLLDLLNPSYYPIGVNALLFTLVALGVGLIGQDPFRSGVIRSVPVALAAALGYRAARLLVERILSYNNFQLAIIVQVILPVVVIDAALMLFVFGLVRGISRIRAPRE